MQQEIDLSGLRDIHLLAEPSTWPLATGWWVLFVIVILTFIAILLGYTLWRKTPIAYAIRKLNDISQKETNNLTYLKKISNLLRRVAIAKVGRTAVASLSDNRWQDFLLAAAPDVFTKEETHLIAFSPYTPQLENPLDRSVLTQHTEEWIKKVLKTKNSLDICKKNR